MIRRAKPRQEREPTIALINIVFLMLVFFLVAGTIAQPLDSKLKLVNTADLEGTAPADALVIHAEGNLTYRGEAIESVADYVDKLSPEQRKIARLVPDKNVPAKRLIEVGRLAREAGVEKVRIVTERGVK